MTMSAPVTLDLRDELRNGGEPLPRILQTVAQLQPEQTLRLLTTFEPIPLYTVLGHKGYAHAASRIGKGDWEIVFTPGATPPEKQPRNADRASPGSASNWPLPRAFLDNRGLQPPEPMIRILDMLEQLAAGEVLQAINEREPMFLYPELEARGAAIQVSKQPDGVRLLIRRGV